MGQFSLHKHSNGWWPELGFSIFHLPICHPKAYLIMSAADVKMEIPVLVRSLKSSILSSTNFQMGKSLWGVASVAVEQSRRKANMVAQGDGKFGSRGWTQNPSKPKKGAFSIFKARRQLEQLKNWTTVKKIDRISSLANIGWYVSPSSYRISTNGHR